MSGFVKCKISDSNIFQALIENVVDDRISIWYKIPGTNNGRNIGLAAEQSDQDISK